MIFVYLDASISEHFKYGGKQEHQVLEQPAARRTLERVIARNRHTKHDNPSRFTIE